MRVRSKKSFNLFQFLPYQCFTSFLVHVSHSSLFMFHVLPCSCFTFFLVHVLLFSLFMFYFLPYPCFSFFLVHVLFSSLFMFPRMHVLSCTSFQFSSKDGGSPIAAWGPQWSLLLKDKKRWAILQQHFPNLMQGSREKKIT